MLPVHAEDFIRKRLFPAEILNVGKQTFRRGHPVFKVQHPSKSGTISRRNGPSHPSLPGRKKRIEH